MLLSYILLSYEKLKNVVVLMKKAKKTKKQKKKREINKG